MIVDFRTGERYAPRPEDFCAKIAPSAVEPLAVVQQEIEAVEAELAVERRDADPDKFSTEAMPPGHDGEQCGDTDT